MKRLLLPAAVCLLWLGTLDAPFTYDDKIEVVGNRTIQSLGELGAIASYNTSRPLLIATYALNWSLGGEEPFGYHVVSIAIHALNALLVQRLFARLLPAPQALVAAWLWALHPMCTESVTYISGRSDALCATAWLVALTAWIDGRRGLAVGAVAAGLLTKEVAIGLPLALLALDRFVLRRPLRAVDHAPFAALGLGAVILRLWMYGWPAGEVERGLLVQVTSQAEVWWRYLGLWALPIGQSILHDHPAELGARGLVATAGWAAVGALAWRARGLPAFAAALWAAVLIPSSAVPLLETMAEHRSYIAGLGPALLVSGLVGRRAWALVLPLALATWLRHDTWSSEVRLWGEAAARNPRSTRAWYGSGDALRFERRWAEAEAAYRVVLELDPDHVDARINLGIMRAEQGARDEARSIWLEALRRSPSACAAHANLAELLRREGEVLAAIQRYTSALAFCPRDARAHLALAELHDEAGDTEKARRHFEEFLSVAPPGPAADAARKRLGRLE